jgi:hypothetical protein
MDIWGMLFAGRQWTEDDGAQKSTVYAADQFKTTMIALENVDPRDPKFKVHWASMSMEVLRTIGEQLDKMRDNIIHRAQAGDIWRNTLHAVEKSVGNGPNPFYECPFCGQLDPGDLMCSSCGKLMKPPERIA